MKSDSANDDRPTKKQKTMQLTEEQEAIIKHVPSLNAGDLVRIIAGAGTGKTTTLLLLAKELLQQNQKIMYLVYNKSAQVDGQNRFQGLGNKISCFTMHGAALKYTQFPTETKEIEEEDVLSRAVFEHFQHEIRAWLRMNNALHSGHRAEKRNAILIELVSFWIFKTLLGFCRSKNKLGCLRYADNTYFPCKRDHKERLGFANYGDFYVSKAKKVWDLIWKGKFPMIHDVYLKYAQLGSFSATGYYCILLDESQDTNACQIDLFVNQQRDQGKKVIIVGDAVQTIYSFRGAKSINIQKLENPVDFTLTTSFRFGPEIAKIANMFLAMKEFSPQAKHFTPYRLTGSSSFEGKIVQDDLPTPFTTIGRANESLVIRGVELLTKNGKLKIAVNGGLSKFKSVCRLVRDVLAFSLGTPPNKPFFKKYDDYEEFKQDVIDKEIQKYSIAISLVENNDPATLIQKIEMFENMILEKAYTLEEADVILTTTHGAKGLEYDNVEVLEDFAEIRARRKLNEADKKDSFEVASLLPKLDHFPMEFDFKDYGDDINLWYVAVTRAKKQMKLPEVWWSFYNHMMKVLNKDEKEKEDPKTKGLKLLFANLVQ